MGFGDEIPKRGLGMKSPSGVWGLESRARCAGFSVTEIGNRKERVRDYASFPDRQPHRNPCAASKKRESGSEAFPDSE